jgi:type VI secretion system secreted protein Hcp
MQGKISARLVVLVAAAVITSAVVAAIALGGSFGTQAVKEAQTAKAPPAGDPPKPNGQVAGQLVFASGKVGNGAPIQILSFAWGASNPVTVTVGGNASAGRVSFSSLNFLKNVDESSADLMSACAAGQNLGDATFTTTWGSGPTAATLALNLTDVFVESIQQSGGGGGAPTESLSLRYTTVKWTFTDASGTSSGGWNIITGTPIP